MRVWSRARKEGTRWAGGEGEKESPPGVRVGAAEGRGAAGCSVHWAPGGQLLWVLDEERPQDAVWGLCADFWAFAGDAGTEQAGGWAGVLISQMRP